MKRISSIFTVSLLVLILGLTGCGLQKTGTQKVRDLDYTVVTEQELPEELQMQETGGYSIQVQDLYLAQNAIYFEADLIGPENGAEAEKAVSYPYIVVKTERLEENVVFE